MSNACAYIYQHGSRAGLTCQNPITALDIQGKYCSTHYKLNRVKPVATDRTEVEVLRDRIVQLQKVIQVLSKPDGSEN
jgi:hypothetical protein